MAKQEEAIYIVRELAQLEGNFMDNPEEAGRLALEKSAKMPGRVFVVFKSTASCVTPVVVSTTQFTNNSSDLIKRASKLRNEKNANAVRRIDPEDNCPQFVGG
jgi:hypothetical protein